MILALAGVSVFFAILMGFSGSVYGQTDDVLTSEQITLSENLENDPMAQDILRKIEQSKKEIAKIQQEELERKNANKELEQKRAEALESLQKDLKEWEALWEEFTFEYRFGQKSGIFWDQYNFTNSKILAGKSALKQALDQGANAEQARAAYAEAAKTKRSELILVNAIFNVRHNLALYNQQILFDSNGQFHDIISGDQLRKYYTDYRLDPIYLTANHDDEIAWSEMSRDVHAVCQEGYVLVYRIHSGDHICTTKETSEIWVMHGMGNILFDESIQDTDSPTVEKLKQDMLKEKVKNINNKIRSAYKAYEAKLDDVKEKYDLLFLDYKAQQTEEEEKAITESKGLSKEDLDRRIRDIREKYAALEENVSKEKIRTLEILESNHKKDMEIFMEKFEPLSDVKIVWNHDESRYGAVQELS